jgi:transcriptional regulator with XRE-family HTH domain
MQNAPKRNPEALLMRPEHLAEGLGHALRLGREARGETLTQSAKAAGLTVAALRNLERGRGTMVDLVRLSASRGFTVPLWHALQPQPRTLEELDRVEKSRMLDRGVGPGGYFDAAG